MLTTYTELKASIADWLNRADLTAVIPDFVSLVEADLGRTLKGRNLRTTVAVTFDETGAVALPGDFVRPVSLTLETDLYSWPIEVKSYEYLIQKRSQLVSGPPRYAAVVGTELLTAPVSDTTTGYAGVLIYDQALAALSASNATNWVLASHPDCYLFGALYHAAPYLKDDGRIPVWENRYRQVLEQIRVLRDEAEYDINTPVARPISALGE